METWCSSILCFLPFYHHISYKACKFTWPMWSWIPPKAIILRVWRVICSASNPSVEPRFADQYDIRNIRFTGMEKQCQSAFNCNQHSSEKHHSCMQTRYICRSNPCLSIAALGVCTYVPSDPSSICLPGVGNLGASFESSYVWASCWKHLWDTSLAEGRVSSEWAEMVVAFRRASITRSPPDSSASLLIFHWNGYQHKWKVRQENIHSRPFLCYGYLNLCIWHDASCVFMLLLMMCA